MSEKSFLDKFKQKAGQVLGHPYVQQASALGNEVLNITSNLAHNRNPLSVGSALMASANVIADALNIEFMNPINFYANKHDLKLFNGELHRLMIKAGALSAFNVSTVLKYDTMSLVKLTIDEKSAMYWVNQSQQVRQFDIYADNDSIVKQYWLSPEFDYEAVHSFFWKHYSTGINLSYGKSSSDSSIEIEISALPPSNQYAEMSQYSVSEMVDYLRLSKELKISRSFLLYGKPGTGKTSWCERIAQDFGNRLVKVDTSFLEQVDNKEIEQILSILHPEIVLFDDFDRIDFEEFEGKFLYVTENLKRKYPAISFFATANNTDAIGEALLRPGRFDEKIKFSAPDIDSSLHVMRSYSLGLGVRLNEEEVRKAFRGRRFTPAECKEVVLRLKLRPSLKIEDILDELRAFSPQEDEESEEEHEQDEGTRKRRGRPRKSE